MSSVSFIFVSLPGVCLEKHDAQTRFVGSRGWVGWRKCIVPAVQCRLITAREKCAVWHGQCEGGMATADPSAAEPASGQSRHERAGLACATEVQRSRLRVPAQTAEEEEEEGNR